MLLLKYPGLSDSIRDWAICCICGDPAMYNQGCCNKLAKDCWQKAVDKGFMSQDMFDSVFGKNNV